MPKFRILVGIVAMVFIQTTGALSQVRPITPPVKPPVVPPLTPPLSPSGKPTATPPDKPTPTLPPSVQPPPSVTPPMELGPESGGPPAALPRSYLIAVCLSDYDVTSDCLEKSALEASEKLATMILKQYFKGKEVKRFSVLMPRSAPSIEQIQFLRKLEGKAIAIVKAKILEDIRSVKAFWWESEAVKPQIQ